MLRPALEGIRTELNAFLETKIANGNNGPIVRLMNIAGIDQNGGTAPTDAVIMSLVNVEEETTLKNGSIYKQPTISTVVRVNPPLFLNFYVLFAVNSTTEVTYLNALLLVSNIIAFFQRKAVFTHDNTPTLDPGIEKLVAELYSANFEQLNHLWAMLGGKYMPSVLYRIRMLMIEDTESEPGSLVTSIELSSHLL
ncbi:DUF4255 domain-containing protein [Spirosoma taeanense]|uniref:DUF4255 domain-containing protein n=1 Tax=Spirosoma taeanense TaxID=2735870 RepID=A0A6M5Y3I0_9BACT|nr:DUF4255 domain-containing protein [Spirosoma taeanense]QJW89127.1 DUF4255 domain-containing protein [Spirosoma taeanense]